MMSGTVYRSKTKGIGKNMKAFRLFTLFVLLVILSKPSFGEGGNLSAVRDSLAIGDYAPLFVMRDLITNEPVILRDYTGKTLHEPWKNKERHVVVLSFWATWCQPCKNEIPHLTKLSEKFRDKPVKIFLVNTLERAEQTEDSVRDVYHTRGYTLPCLLDPAIRYAGLYTVYALPVLVVIDKFGIVRKINRGYHENFEIELEKLIGELIEENESIRK
jgi:thiol-disulfide isomerase/thioredoxin